MLQAANELLKKSGVKGRLVAMKGRLFLRGTYTDSKGDRKDRRVALGVAVDDVLEAQSRAISLTALINSSGYVPDLLPWQTPAPEKREATEEKRISVDEAVERLKADFWQGKVKSSAAQRTLDRLLAETARLPQQATLTMDLLVAIGDQQQPGSRTRQEFLKVAKRLALLVGIEGTDRLDVLRTIYEPGVRDVPSDEEIVDFMGENDPTSIWVWATWALATYGCRPSETFSLVENGDGTARVLTIKRKLKLPTWRTALALPLTYVKEELVDDMRGGDSFLLDRCGPKIVPYDVKTPKDYDSAVAKLHTDRWARWIRRQHPTLTLYDLRHAWAIRSITKMIPTSLAAKCMGHRVIVHHETYHRWLDQSDIAAVAASLK